MLGSVRLTRLDVARHLVSVAQVEAYRDRDIRHHPWLIEAQQRD